ncbi:MAG TPA: FAD-dependent oxidoreductase, partial [Chloroflexota bacterium]|nr:FAD-dependent oxidoreductase [Chloroflexota bacterium]
MPGRIGHCGNGDLPGPAASASATSAAAGARARLTQGEVKAVSVSRRSLLIGAGGAAVSPLLAKPMVKKGADRVAIVGAGVFGAWTAHHLQQAGHKVTLIDAWGPAHSRASSGGESRLTRAAYGKDAIYTRMAMDSLPQWKALSAVSGLPIFIPSGILFFFPTEEPYVRDSIAAHKKLGLSTDVLTQAEMARRFPMIDFDGITVGLYEPEFGALMARRSVITLVDRFVKAGGTYFKGFVEPPSAGDRLNGLRLSSAERISADRFVFAAGP